MTDKRLILCLLLLIATSFSMAQPASWMGKKKPYKWQFGLGWNAVEDDGRGFCQPFDVNESWNIPVFPSRFMADRYLHKGFSVELAGAYNDYKSGKLINSSTNLSGLFIAVDLNGKFSFYQLLQPRKWLDPYVSLGVGGTYREAHPQNFVPTANLGAGVNFWVLKSWGIQLQASSKFGINEDFFTTNANYMHYSASILYKIQGDQRDNSFSKKRYKWTKSRPKFKGGGKKQSRP